MRKALPDWNVLIRLVLVLVLIFSVTVAVSADEPNVGILRVYSFAGPKAVAPNSLFTVTLDVEYGLHGRPDNATIRAAIYGGSVNYGSPIWQSEPEIVKGGGDKVWSTNLTASQTQGSLTLVAIAYFLDQGSWRYFNNSINGPSFGQLIIKIATNANLEVGLGAPNVAITIDDTALKTQAHGDAHTILPVGTTHVISVPPIVEFPNSTRIVFNGWSDGNNQTQRAILVDGDVELHGSYKIQYALHVNSIVSSYTEWYDSGSNATLQSPRSVPVNWPLSLLGLKYNFEGWSGDISSTRPKINLTMDKPMTLDADYSFDYAYLIIPGILAAGVCVCVFLTFRHRRDRAKVSPEPPAHISELRCPHCGEAIEESWAHCIKCGGALAGPASKG